jgi:hypothetical protein
MGINVVVLVAIASISVASGADTPASLRWIVYAVAATLPVYLGIIAWRPPALARIELFAPLFDLGLGGHLKSALARLPHVVVMMLSQWIMMRCFGVATPLSAAALYLPIVFAVAALPISAQGLGTSQLLSVRFFSQYAGGNGEAQGAAVLAYSLYLIAMWVPAQLVIGAFCLRTDFGQTVRLEQPNGLKNE